jgi:putative tricarboxylic transport membrane protein
MLISQGDLTVFWSNWLVATITTLALLLLAWPLLAWLLRGGVQLGRRPVR